ncbi:hypothetical protein [Actinoplanes sp. L3-i22]|uniref:hypothetical protein n=1 Tax=Actinoplanes sp. L3-i22 TaxID=2836373 RepID=UPI001C750D4D|nr:hypothetical protein [Actinoplanes sp. L3-i22]BCY08947.1 hypothetical protein L3i22_040350 [Actinoplanes sp. L3-i22]
MATARSGVLLGADRLERFTDDRREWGARTTDKSTQVAGDGGEFASQDGCRGRGVFIAGGHRRACTFGIDEIRRAEPDHVKDIVFRTWRRS